MKPILDFKQNQMKNIPVLKSALGLSYWQQEERVNLIKNSMFTGFSNITVGPTPPPNPLLYDLWIDTN
jgi:hypothetical protein